MKGSTGFGRLDGFDDVRSERAASVNPQTTADVIALLNAGVISLREARGFLGLDEEMPRCA
jgi:hypothetical protein